MAGFSQGDIIKIRGYRHPFLIVSKNAFIRSTGVFHVCPFFPEYEEGPLHIAATGVQETKGVAIIEHVKLIDPAGRACRYADRIPYRDIMEISDALQGVFEYD